MKEQDKKEKEMTPEEKSFLAQYKKEIQALKLPDETEREGLCQKAIAGEPDAIGLLTQSYLPAIVKLAEEKWLYGLHIGDLIQEGSMAVFEAISELDKSPAGEATSYIEEKLESAMEAFRQEHISTALEDSRIADKLNKLADAVEELSKDFGNEFSVEDLSAYTGFTVEEMKELVRIAGEEMPGQEGEEAEK